MLTNRVYIGEDFFKPTDPLTKERVPKDEWIKVPCPSIISDQQFYAVQKALHDRAPNVTAPRITNSAVLLGGIAYCGCPGRHSPLQLATGTSRTGKVHRYYKCASRIIRGDCCAEKPISIPEGELDEIVISALCDDVLQPDRLQAIVKAFAEREATAQESASARSKSLR